jgi:CheY-like chemotaxis protein
MAIRILHQDGDSEGAQARRPDARFQGLRILVVEDNTINQVVIASLLEALGCDTPDVAGDGREALAAFRNKKFDIVFMDCQLPELNGYAATARIRRLEAKGNGNRRCYIAAMTADIMPGVEEKCRAAGMDGRLGKPYIIEDLVATLELARDRASAGGFHAARSPERPDGAGSGIDIRILDRLRLLGGRESPSVFRDLVLGFLDKGAEKIIAIRELALARELRPLAFAAHGFKGLCLNFGALAMARECGALQGAAEEGRQNDLPRILERLTAEGATTRTFLENMLGTGAADAGTPSAAPEEGNSDG